MSYRGFLFFAFPEITRNYQKLDSVLSLNAARIESYWPLAFGYKLMAEKWGRENQVVGIASC